MSEQIPEEYVVIDQNNFERFSLFLEILEENVRNGGKIILPKLTSVTDMTHSSCTDKSKKISFAYVGEVPKEYRKECLTGNTMPFMLAIVPPEDQNSSV